MPNFEQGPGSTVAPVESPKPESDEVDMSFVELAEGRSYSQVEPQPAEVPQTSQAEGMATVEQADPALEARPGNDEVRALRDMSEPEPSSWQQFSEATKNLVRGAYEHIKNSDPIQNALDKYTIWREGGLTSKTDSKVKNVTEKANAFKRVGDEKQAWLEAHRAKMQAAGIEVTTDDETELLKEIQTARTAQAEQQKKLEGTQEEVGLKAKYENHRALVDGAAEKINGRLEKKIQANQEAINVLREKEQEFLERKQELEKILKKLQNSFEELQQDLKKATGGKKKLLQGSLAQIEGAQRVASSDYGVTAQKLGELQEKIQGLENKNASWKKQKKPSFDERRQTVATSTPTAQSTPSQPSAPAAPRQASRRPPVYGGMAAG